jgi:transposase InsO family protein
VKFAFIQAEKAHYPVVVLCAVLGVSRSGFYAWQRRPPSARSRGDARLGAEIAATYARSQKRYGSPRIHRALRKRGLRVGKKRVARLMRETSLIARAKRRFRRTTDSRHTHPIAPNLLARNFTCDAPNQTWVGDVTYIATRTGWAYLAVILDLFSRRVVGWAIRDTNDTELALTALRHAVQTRGGVPKGLVHHTDRGSPYASDDYRRALGDFGMRASMSRKGDCWDNAVAESFFATLRAELVRGHVYRSLEAAEDAIGLYIESFYNLERLHSTLDYVSPVEFELKAQVAAFAA